MTTTIEQYSTPPVNYESSTATHFVHFPWQEDWTEEGWQAISELSRRESGDIVTSRCTSVFSDLPNFGNPDVLARLSHKSLVEVIRERVGENGLYHYVKVVATNPSVNGVEGYVHYQDLVKLPGIPASLPVVFNCVKLDDQNGNFCSLRAARWYETTEPYLDEYECAYKINISTEYTDTGGDTELKRRMEEQVPLGVAELLEYYDKVATEENIARLLSAFKFAEATNWYLDLEKPNSNLKVLIAIPAKYFDAIPEADSMLESISDGIERYAVLESSTIQKDIERLATQMNRWGDSRVWYREQSKWYGPDPYMGYNFAREARRLETFLSLLRRLLALNGKSIRPKSNDTIEIGMTRDHTVRYVLLTDDDGTHKMKVGFQKLLSTDPFNHPRTIAYIYNLFEISNQMKKSGSLPGGWPMFLKKYTFPPPEHKPASKKENCFPTFKDPFKCAKDEWRDYKDQHLKDIKCEDLPSEMKTTPLDLGRSEGARFYRAIETGEWSGYQDKLASVRKERANILSKKSIDEWKKNIREENDKYGGSLDFVGDPFVENLAAKLDTGFEGFGRDVFEKFMTDVVVKVDIKDITGKLHQCLCDDMRRHVQKLKIQLQDEHHPLVKAEEAAMAGLGCDNLCKVLPILCSCLPIPWPLTFDLPDDFSIPDILRFLTAAIIDAIITAVFKFLLDLIKGAITSNINCDRNSRESRNFIDQFESKYPYEEENFSQDDIAATLKNSSVPANLVDTTQINALISDTILLLTPREFCELISGDPSVPTLQAVSFLINEKYLDFKEVFSNYEKISSLYESLGSLIDPNICKNIDELITAVGVEPGGYICDETNLRDDIAAGRATSEQTKQILLEASRCNSDKLASISSLVNDLMAGNNPLSSIMPNIFQTPANPNGIIPREPPPIKYTTDIANDSIFGGIQRKFYSEMNTNIPTLITTTTEVLPPSRTALIFESLGVNLDQPGDDKLNKGLKRTIADGLGNALRQQAREISNYRTSRPLIKLAAPERDIFPDTLRIGNYSPGVNLYELLPIPGFSSNTVTNAQPSGTEKIEIEYDICNESSISINWNRVRDAYTVRVRDAFPESGPVDLITFDGKKKIKDNVVDLYEDFRSSGNFSPSRELFSNLIANKWTELPWPQQVGELLLDPNNSLNSFHANAGFKSLTTDIVSRLALVFSKSPLLDAGPVEFLGLGEGSIGGRITFDEAFQNLKSINFRPDTSCSPQQPGILNMDDVRAKVSELFDNDLDKDSGRRYVRSIQHGVIATMVRVYCIHTILDGIFPFSQFKTENILKSDLLVSYLLNKFRGQLQRQLQQLFRGRRDLDFYEKIKSLIGADLAQRKYVNLESFIDPFTNEEVDVRLDPVHVQRLVESTQHDPTGLIETIDLEEIQASESGFVTDEPNLESVLNCYVAGVDEFVSTGISECVPQTSAESDNESSDGTLPESGNTEALQDSEVAQPNTGAGKRPIGFMEFFLKEQLKSISGEVEVMFGSQIYDIDELMINGLSAVVDVPQLYNPSGPRIFKNLSQSTSNISEQELVQAGLSDIVEIYDTYYESTLDDDSSFLDRLAELNINQDLILRYISQIQRGDDVLQLIAEDISSILQPRTADISQSDLIDPKFKYLETGGFITERYIKIQDLSQEEWQEIIDTDPVGQIAYDKINNRPNYLKGVVNLRDWDYFIRDLTRGDNIRSGLAAALVDRRDDVDYINFKKYFKNWVFGKRMCYVYPLADVTENVNIFQILGNAEIKHMLNNVLQTAVDDNIQKIIENDKTFIIQESVELALNIQTDPDITPSDDNLSLLEGQTLKGDRTYNIFSVPVITSEMALNDDVEIMPLTNRGVGSTYNKLYDNRLTKDMASQDSYRALFEYVFPLDRFVSLLTIYTAEYVSSLPGREQLFDGTKSMLLDMYYNLEDSLQDDWWEKPLPGTTPAPWYEKPLDLSVPGILFMTPYKILQALLTLVPPLDWFLDGLLSLLPDLPPYKSSKENPCPENNP